MHAESIKKLKVETTYEYVRLIGEILGYWRKEKEAHVGKDVELHIRTPLSQYDRLYINGFEIDLGAYRDEIKKRESHGN